MKKNSIVYLLFLVAIFLVFRNWIFAPELIGGDWPYLYSENVKAFTFLPSAWNSMYGGGFGGSHVIYSLDSFLYFTGWLFSNVLQISWPITYKISWFALVIALSLFSIHHLLKQLRFNIPLQIMLPGMFLYIANTYILMVVGGGQLGVGLGYAVMPLVLSFFIRVISGFDIEQKKQKQIMHKEHLYNALLAGSVLSLQVLFDFRLAYVTLCAVSVYYIFFFKRNIFQFIYTFLIPLLVTALLHMFWLLPFSFMGQTSTSQMGAMYISTNALTYFSFAFFENAIGLLQPNWPENIFGKVGFMKPEFLILPLLIFSVLFFVQDKLVNSFQKKNIIFFTMVALLGIFLAKGANDPFGNFNIWLFETIPGFIMFRDPTKWYTLISISYAVLITLNLYLVIQKINLKKKSRRLQILNRYNILIILVLVFLSFLIRPAILGELGGTFAKHTIPNEYLTLKRQLLTDEDFSRTLWIPRYQRFGFGSENHPAVEPLGALQATNSAEVLKEIKKETTEKKLANLSIKYIIVPLDSEHEIFLKDRKYNAGERNMIIAQLKKTPWLKQDTSFKELAVFNLKENKNQFWMNGSRKVDRKKISDTDYVLSVSSGAAEKLIFNESYSPYWVAKSEGKELMHKKFGNFNSYDFPQKKKSSDITLSYALSSYYFMGRIISLLTLIVVLYFLLRPFKGFTQWRKM